MYSIYEPGCRNNAAFKLAKTLREKNQSTLTSNTIPRYKQDVVTIEDCVDSTEGTKNLWGCSDLIKKYYGVKGLG